MGLSMNLQEVWEQNEAMNRKLQSENNALKSLMDVCDTFSQNQSLVAKSYTSAKSYFSMLYKTSCQGIIYANEEVMRQNSQFPDQYISEVSALNLKEDELIDQIKVAQDSLNYIDFMMNEAKKSSSDGGDMGFGMYLGPWERVKSDLENKLERLREFNYASAGNYDTAIQMYQEVTDLMIQGRGGSWDALSQTFQTKQINTSTVQKIQTVWAKREAEIIENRLKEYTIIKCTEGEYGSLLDKGLGDTDVDLIKGLTGVTVNKNVSSDNKSDAMWAFEKNGVRVSDAEAMAYLMKISKNSDLSEYNILEITPKEWEERVLASYKNDVDYFSGEEYRMKLPIFNWSVMGALARGQTFVDNTKKSGAWDSLWTLGFFYAGTKNILTYNDIEMYVENPNKLKFVDPADLYKYFENNGYNPVPLSKGGTQGINFADGGGFKVTWGGDRLIQYHPGGGVHSGSYYKISSGDYGSVRIPLDGNFR